MAKLLSEIHSWQDFKSSIEGLTKKQKGDAFEALTLAYLQLEPRYATKLKEIWPLRKVPIETRDYLGLPVTDEGIDFVAETVDGKYWAIQSKYKDDETSTLGLGDLGTFTSLAFVTCKDKFDFALVVTTASGLSSKFPKNYGNKIGQVCYRDWQELDHEFFDQLNSLAKDRFTPATPRTPRPHQAKAIEAAVEYFLEEGNRRGKLSHPCASGKSLTGNWIADRFDAKMVLVAVPSLSLVRQALKDYLRETLAKGETANWIAVCSDDLKELDDGDGAILPQDLGIKIHTNVDEIADWLRQSNGNQTYVFSTYQSGRALAEASRKANVTFDLGIFDEAHRTVGKRDSLFSHLLFDDNVAINRRVFMTATERFYRGGSEQFICMSDPGIYGETFDVMTFKDALDSEPPILCDYKIVTMDVTKAEVNELVAQNLFVRPKGWRGDNEVEAQMLASAVALRKAMNKHPIKHAVSFHGSIIRASAFQKTQQVLNDTFPEFGELDVFHVTGSTPTATRARELERFTKAERSLITNARCLTEGVDVPGIDCVLFADPRRSTVDIVQAVGRALRLADGKDFGYVIVPVLVDRDLAHDPEAQFGAFEPVLTVIKALGANDDRIIEYFRSRTEGRKTGRAFPNLIDLPESVTVDAGDFIESIELKIWSRLAKLSWRTFEDARLYARGLGLKSVTEWHQFCQQKMPEVGLLPADIPVDPAQKYAGHGWVSWGDWLGTDIVATKNREYRPFAEARKFARRLNLESETEWRSYCRGEYPDREPLPNDIPASPAKGYSKEDGWQGFGDWLGTGNIAPRYHNYRPFEEARTFVRSLCLNSEDEWRLYCKGQMPEKGTLPRDIPAYPNQTYSKEDGWEGMRNWLGLGPYKRDKRKFRPFLEARDFVRSLRLKSFDEWVLYSKGGMPKLGKRPHDIPSNPQKEYKDDGWLGYDDWLGTGKPPRLSRKYRSFKIARDFVRGLSLNGEKEWRLYSKGAMPDKGTRPYDIPSKPERTYKDKGWVSWPDWLGKD